jgi:hypothetical protein
MRTVRQVAVCTIVGKHRQNQTESGQSFTATRLLADTQRSIRHHEAT